jgi:hypothetical protein
LNADIAQGIGLIQPFDLTGDRIILEQSIAGTGIDLTPSFCNGQQGGIGKVIAPLADG